MYVLYTIRIYRRPHSDPKSLGKLTQHQVDTHETDPARDYSIKIEAHKDVPDSQFSEFLKSGIVRDPVCQPELPTRIIKAAR